MSAAMKSTIGLGRARLAAGVANKFRPSAMRSFSAGKRMGSTHSRMLIWRILGGVGLRWVAVGGRPASLPSPFVAYV